MDLVSGNPVTANTVISSTVFNNTMQDIASELTNSVARDGQSVMQGNLQMGGHRITGIATSAADNDALTVGQAKVGAEIGVSDWTNSTLNFWVKGRPLNLLSDSTLDSMRSGLLDVTARVQAAIDTGATAIYIPSKGNLPYVIGALNIRSNLEIFGDGDEQSSLIWSFTNKPTPIAMFNATGDVSNLHIHGLRLIGNRAYQTSVDTQKNCAFHLRAGSLSNICIENLSVREFGDVSGTGGSAGFIGPISGSGLAMHNIEIKHTKCANISNVPGWYINANQNYVSSAKGLKLHNNILESVATNADQNFIFVLTAQATGSTTLYYKDVDIDGNVAYVDRTIDCFIEVNDVSSCNIKNNKCFVSGSANATPILCRGGIKDLIIADNTMVNEGTGCASNDAIVLTPYASERMKRIKITGNTAVDFRATGIKMNSCDVISASKNDIIGDAYRISNGISFAGCNNVKISGGLVKNAINGVVMASGSGGISTAEISSVTFDAVGNGAGSAIILSAGLGEDITGLNINNNLSINHFAGTSHFISVSTSWNFDNYASGNRIHPGLNTVNPSHAASFSAIEIPARETGISMVAVRSVSWSQGVISFGSTGTTYTIPAGGLSIPDASISDIVLVSVNQSTAGTSYNGYINPSDGRAYVTITNVASGANSIPAGTWDATVVRRQ